MANNKCKECGCYCSVCSSSDHDVHLHVEIENLKQRLVERDNHIVTMETNFLNEAEKYPSGEVMALRDELITWQDKYKRLYEAHRRVQRVNQGLEDKLLRLVDVTETDKSALTKDVATLSHKLAEANYRIKKLTNENERYKNDVSLAIQFLQCKPGNFVSQKFDTLPNEVQAKVSTYMTNKRKPEEKKINPEMKSIKVPIPTFPPTAMVYSIPKSPSAPRKFKEDAENSSVDIVSAAIMAKVLEERELERMCIKHCDTCMCSKNPIVKNNVSTQTIDSSKTDSKIKSVQVHDYNEPNIVKVEPNNFLADVKGVKKNKMIVLPQIKTSNPTKSAIMKSLQTPHTQINTFDNREVHTEIAQFSGDLDKILNQTSSTEHHKTASSICDNLNVTNDLIQFTTPVNENVNKKINQFPKSKKVAKESSEAFCNKSNNLNESTNLKDSVNYPHDMGIFKTTNDLGNNFNLNHKIDVDCLNEIKSSSYVNNDLLQSTSATININTIAKVNTNYNKIPNITNNGNIKDSFDSKHLQNFNYVSNNISVLPDDRKLPITNDSYNFVNESQHCMLNQSSKLNDIVLSPVEITICDEKVKQDKFKNTAYGSNRSKQITNVNIESSTSQDPAASTAGAFGYNITSHQQTINNSNIQNVSNNILLDNIEDYKPKLSDNEELNIEKYKEMEDNVKKFLFGEVNIVSTLNKCDT